jgi:hypothetical protein
MKFLHTAAPLIWLPRCAAKSPLPLERPRFAARSSSHRGAILVVMLVLLAVVMLLTAGWAGRIVSERRQLRRHFIVLQAIRLAESGLDRGEARLTEDALYTGEDWEIPASSWSGNQSARVQISVEPDQPEAGFARISARATYPCDHEQAVRRTRSTTVRIPR